MGMSSKRAGKFCRGEVSGQGVFLNAHVSNEFKGNGNGLVLRK